MNFLIDFPRLKSKDFVFFAFILLYSFFLVFLCNKMNIWEDEAYSLNTTSKNLAEVISESYHFEGQPPVYFLVLTLWRLIYPGVFFARLLSLIFIGLAAFFFHRVVCLISGSDCSKWLVVLFLLNPFAVWAALEIRAYGLLILLSTISIYFFIRYIIGNKKEHLYYFLLICLIGFYTQYFFVFLIASLSLTLLIFKGWRAFFSLCLYLIPLSILFLPNLIFLYGNLAMAQASNPDYLMIQRISLFFNSVQNIILAMNLIPYNMELRWSARIIFILIVIIAFIKIYKDRNIQTNFNSNNIIAVLVSFSVLAILFTIYLVITGIRFNDRYLAIAFPIIMLILIIFRKYSFFTRTVMFSILSLYFTILLIHKYSSPVKTYDYQAVVNYINKVEQAEEPILLNSSTISVAFEYYYNGTNPFVPLPDTFKLTKNGFQVLIRDTLELKQLIGSIKSNSKSILFLNDNLIDYSYVLKLNTQMLDKCLYSNYSITLDTLFIGENKHSSIRIRRLENFQ